MKAIVLASVLAALVTADAVAAADPVPPLTQVMLLPVDKDGNPYGELGPWAYYVDLENEPAPPAWVLDSMAFLVAAYLKAHPGTELRIDGAGEQGVTTVQGTKIRDRRISAIRTALIKAGVPARSIVVGPK